LIRCCGGSVIVQKLSEMWGSGSTQRTFPAGGNTGGSSLSNFVSVHPDFSAKALKELVELVKTRPSSLGTKLLTSLRASEKCRTNSL